MDLGSAEVAGELQCSMRGGSMDVVRLFGLSMERLGSPLTPPDVWRTRESLGSPRGGGPRVDAANRGLGLLEKCDFRLNWGKGANLRPP